MIPVTKEEAKLLRELYPEYKVTRTMVQDSKRHHYYATEHEGMMRAQVQIMPLRKLWQGSIKREPFAESVWSAKVKHG